MIRGLLIGMSFLLATSAIAGSREKVIDFEDQLVEGINKKPLDSLSQVSERERARRKRHLYRKRVSFRTETIKTVKELRYN